MTPKLIIGALCWSSIFSILWSVKRMWVAVTLVNTSQMLGPLPSSFQAPSIWSRCKMTFCVEKSLSYLIGSRGRSPEEVIRKGIKEQLFLRTVGKSKSKAAQ